MMTVEWILYSDISSCWVVAVCHVMSRYAYFENMRIFKIYTRRYTRMMYYDIMS